MLFEKTSTANPSRVSAQGDMDSPVTAHGASKDSTAEDDYKIILPRFPTDMFDTSVILHADVRERPYNVADFKTALSGIVDFKGSVEAFGQYLYNHIWMLTYRTAAQKAAFLSHKELSVEGRRRLVLEPRHAVLQLRVHWLPPQVPDGELSAALVNYGKVEITREVWPDPDLGQMQSMVRQVQLKAKEGVSVPDIPHMIGVRGVQILVQCRGRPPMCLKCNQLGHIRRNCAVPFCTLCSRFGHEKVGCPKSYAGVTAPRPVPHTEYLMDEDDVRKDLEAEGVQAPPKSPEAKERNHRDNDEVGQASKDHDRPLPDDKVAEHAGSSVQVPVLQDGASPAQLVLLTKAVDTDGESVFSASLDATVQCDVTLKRKSPPSEGTAEQLPPKKDSVSWATAVEDSGPSAPAYEGGWHRCPAPRIAVRGENSGTEKVATDGEFGSCIPNDRRDRPRPTQEPPWSGHHLNLCLLTRFPK